MSTPDESPDAQPPVAPSSADDAPAPVPAPASSEVDERGFLESLEDLGAPDDDVEPREHRVTAVLVAHDGDRWLPATLTALARLARRPDRTVVVDTGSTDGTAELLQRAETLGVVDRVVTLPRETGFGAAVAAGLATGSGTSAAHPSDALAWVWLLHDDSAPAPSALHELLRTSDRTPSADVLGPKQRGWNNTDVLVECGVTVSRSGHRITGLEHRELDQGQHDSLLDVLAVGSAGMLVRREVWDELGGFDPALPTFRDDIDFCWRAQNAGHRVVVATSSVIHHREAATHGRREVSAGSPKHGDRPHRLDRAAALHVMRAHATGLAAPFVTLRLLVGSLLRAVGFLLGKAPDLARDEWGALRDSLADGRTLAASRTRVAASLAAPGSVPAADVRDLLAPRTAQVRHAVDQLAEMVAGRETPDTGASSSLLESGADDPYGWAVDDSQPSRLRRWLTRPGVLLVLGLLLATLVGARALLGSGVLVGGALLPAPDGAGDLWQSYLTAWHEVGPGSAQDAPAWLVPLTLLAFVLRGSASAANDVVLLGVIPLGGLAAYLAMRGVVTTTWLRVWAALTYASLPAVTGALSGGRLGTSVAVVLLPWLARSAARLVGAGGTTPTWRRAFGTGLLLAVVASFTPVVWVLAVVLAVVGAVTVVRTRLDRVRIAVTVLLPVVLLVPWSLRVVREPALLWLEPGLIGPSNVHLRVLDVLLLRPGGTGSTPLWLGIGLVLAGLVALAVPSGRRPVLAAWVVGAAALLLGSVETLLRVTPPPLSTPVTPWPGVATLVWGGALILCAALTVDRIVPRLVRASFGWRQPAAVVIGALLVLAPLGSLAIVVLGVDGPIHRGSRDVLPAFVAAKMSTTDRPRTVVLRRGPAGSVVYDLLAAPTPQTGDIDVAPESSTYDAMDAIVAAISAGVGGAEVDGLAAHGVGYVVLGDVTGRDDPLVATLDGERGLRRLSAQSDDAVWQVVGVSSRAQVVDPAANADAGTVATRVAVGVPVTSPDPRVTTALDSPVTAGAAGRRALLTETYDSRWRWTVGGAAATADQGASTAAADPSLQSVPLAADATTLTASFDGSSRTTWLWVQALVLALTLVLVLPSRRAEEDDDAEVDTLGEIDPAATAAATATAPDDGPDEAAATAPDAATTDRATVDEPVADGPTTDSATTDSATVDVPVADGPTSNSATTDVPAADSATTDGATVDVPAADSPTTVSPTTDGAAVEVPAAAPRTATPRTRSRRKPATTEPAATEPAPTQPARTRSRRKPATAAPATASPATAEPATTETAATETATTGTAPAADPTTGEDA
jgi:GT2 family glycosyltransferase